MHTLRKIIALNIYVFMFSLIADFQVTAQISQQWLAHFSGTGSGANSPNKMLIDNIGNIYIGGRSDSLNWDFITLKYNSSGVLLWQQRYNGTGNQWDVISDMVLDNAGNIYVTGGSIGEGSGADYVTIKYNSNGNMVWLRRFNGLQNYYDGATSIAIDRLSNIYVTGFSRMQENMAESFVTIKYDSSGSQQWVRAFGIRGTNWAQSVVSDDSCNVYVTGYGYYRSVTQGEIVTIKYSTSGGFHMDKFTWLKPR